jgi:hypothetical protein
MSVYVVFREGVYRHECGGVFSTFGKAKEAALALIKGEPDDWHHYVVHDLRMDETATRSSRGTEGELTEDGFYYKLKREKGEIYQYYWYSGQGWIGGKL